MLQNDWIKFSLKIASVHDRVVLVLGYNKSVTEGDNRVIPIKGLTDNRITLTIGFK